MNAATLQAALTTTRFGRRLVYMDVTTSTRDDARRLAEDGHLDHGSVVIAARQTAGRGSPGKAFISEQPLGVWMSVAFARPSPADPISIFAGAAVTSALRLLGVDAHVKWPNDVLVGRRKISGLIADTATTPDGRDLYLLGVGINVLQTDFTGTTLDGIATSCAIEAPAAALTREAVFAHVMAEFERLLRADLNVVELWLEHTRMIGKQIRALDRGRERFVRVTGLAPDGALLVINESCVPEAWHASSTLDIDPSYD